MNKVKILVVILILGLCVWYILTRFIGVGKEASSTPSESQRIAILDDLASNSSPPESSLSERRLVLNTLGKMSENELPSIGYRIQLLELIQ